MRDKKFGWVAPVRAMDDTDGSSLGDQIIRVLEKVRGKFDSVWVSDHVHPPIFGGKNNGTGVLECVSTILYLAGVFPDFDFGSLVLSQPLRNPALVAKMGATLQTLTKGRFILGLGSYSNAGNEYVAYGYGNEFTKAAVLLLKQLKQHILSARCGPQARLILRENTTGFGTLIVNLNPNPFRRL